MEILELIDLAITMENRISVLYGLAAEKASFPHPDLASQLETLSGEKIDHANVLRMGRNYAAKMPEVFSRKDTEIGAIQTRFEESERAMDKLLTEKDLKSFLINLLDLEKRFERLHFAASILIKNDSLKALFASLSKRDNSHILTVNEIIAKL